MKRLCYKCFSELPENANYCPNCGEAMREQIICAPEYRKCNDQHPGIRKSRQGCM